MLCFAPANAIAQSPVLGTDDLALGTVSGVNLNLIFPKTTLGGEIYYYLDHGGGGTSGNTDAVSHDLLDTLFNNGMDTTDTQEGSDHDGTDDARSVIVDGYTLILPTVAELTAFANDSSFDTLPDAITTGPTPYNVWAADDLDTPVLDMHKSVNVRGPALGTLVADSGRGPVFFEVQVAPPTPLTFDITIPTQTYPRNILIPTISLPAASGGVSPLSYTLTGLPTGLAFGATARTISGTETTALSTATSDIALTYTVTDGFSTPQTMALTFTLKRVTVTGDGTLTYNLDPDSNLTGAIAVNNVGGTSGGDNSNDMRLILPESHAATTFTVTTYTPLIADVVSPPDGVTFSDKAMDIALTTGSLTAGTTATVCLSTEGVPERRTPAIYRLSTTWEPLASATTPTISGFICGTTAAFSPFAVGYDAPPVVTIGGTINAQFYQVGETVALTLPTATADDEMGMLSYTLTPTASIPDGLTFDAAARTLAGTPTIATDEVTLTYTATDDTTAMESLTFTVTVMSDTDTDINTATHLNEQILSRAVSAMTASTLAAVAARVEAAVDGIGGSGKPLAFELDGRSSLHALLEKNGKAMLEDTMDYQRLLDGASFVLPLPLSALSATGNAPTGNPGKTAVWGSGDFRNLADDDADGLEWEGQTLSAHLGIDKRFSEQALAGLALSWNDASFDYKDDADNSTNPTPSQGEYQYSVVTINPYFGWSNAGLKLWGTVGFGQGEITIDQEDGDELSTDTTSTDTMSTDTTQLSFAGGFNHRLTDSPGGSLHIKGDIALTQVAVEAEAGKFDQQDIASSRLRLLLSGERRRELASGGALTPSLEIGVRSDGGDGTTGTGIEIGGGLRYANPGGTVAVAGNVRTLLAGDYDELGADFSVRLSSKSGRGLSLTLHPVWGRAQSAADRLWNDGINETAGEITGGDTALRGSVDTEVGYGMSATMLDSPGLLTPYAGMIATEDGNRLRLGGRFVGGNGLSLNLEGAQENATDGASHQVLLRGEVAF